MKRYHSFSYEETADSRARELATYLLKTKGTVRQAAVYFGVSKSTVHKDVTERLKEVDESLWESMQKLLADNKSVRHLRGGQSTKEKYRQHKKST